MSSNGNICHVTGPLCGEFTGQQWIPRTKASDAELWCFLRSTPWINGWVNNREAGDLRYHHPHYDVTMMMSLIHAQKHVHHMQNIWRISLLPSTIVFRLVANIFLHNQSAYSLWFGSHPDSHMATVYERRDKVGMRTKTSSAHWVANWLELLIHS